jgi:hypothetical protein
MLDIAQRPEQVVDRHRRVLARRDEFVKTMSFHAGEMEELYSELGAAGAAR